ncbi:SH3 domain-containing protein [Kitasatospora sp. NPDC057542]|uniref:SH3 domain-containing protein n=1 Tax=Streptomycetaceae TaxID=2062 RepID=UPI001CCD2F75|nr:SH3 domain-containing protein [Streptomyces sp. LS1784]
MHRSAKRTATALLLAAGTLIVPLAAAVPAGAAPTAALAACNVSYGDKDGSSWHKSSKNGVNMRSGPSTGCAVLGVSYSTQLIDYHCYVSASDGTWTYARNDATGVKGWIRDDLLTDSGSRVRC